VQLQPGTLNLFILRALVDGPRHGFAVIAWLRDASAGELAIEEGALYHALHRMERQGWLAAEWGSSEHNRQAKYYRLTPIGRRELQRQTKAWNRYAALAAAVLRPTTRRS
jgi:transcriptional regulator